MPKIERKQKRKLFTICKRKFNSCFVMHTKKHNEEVLLVLINEWLLC